MAQLEELADGLYALPLDEFTAARNELARRTRPDDAALADAVRALGKPSVAAWVVNVFARHRSAQLDQLIELGAALRAAHEELDRDALSELARRRRQVVDALAREAGALAEERGQRVSRAVLDDVSETLQAALTDETAAAAVLTARLLRPLLAVGTEVDLTGAVAAPGELRLPEAEPAPGNVVDLAARRELSAARKAAALAENAVRTAEREREDAVGRLADHDEQRDRLDRELADLEERIARLRARIDDVEHRRREAERDRERAESAVDDARRELDETTARLRRLGGDED